MRLSTGLSLALVVVAAALVAESHFGVKVPVTAEDDAVIMGNAEPDAIVEEQAGGNVVTEEVRKPQQRQASTRVERAKGSYVPPLRSEKEIRETREAMAAMNERAARNAQIIQQMHASSEYKEMVAQERKEMGQVR